MTSAWVERPGFPRVYPSRGAFSQSRARFVNGVIVEKKKGYPVILSGGKALPQAMEQLMIDHFAQHHDVTQAIDHALAQVESYLESVEYVRARGTEVDVAFYTVGVRDLLHTFGDLRGPLGRLADDPVPARKAPAAVAPARVPSVLVPRPAARLPAPSQASLRPLPPEARWVYGTHGFQSDPWGRLWTVVDVPRDGVSFHYLVLDPDGAQVALLPGSTRDELLAQMGGRAHGWALLPSLVGTPSGVWRREHYHAGPTLVERTGPVDADGPFSVGPELSAAMRRDLGVVDGHLLLWSHLDPEQSLEFYPLAGGKRRRVKLPGLTSGRHTLDAALGERGVRVLRLHDDHLTEHVFGLDGAPVAERRLSLSPVEPAVFLVPHLDAVLLGRGREVRLVLLAPSGDVEREAVLLRLPDEPLTSDGLSRQFSWLEVSHVVDPGTWTIIVRFVARDAAGEWLFQEPVIVGAVSFDASGAVRASALLSHDGELLRGTGERRSLGPGPWTLFAATGSLSVLLGGPDGLALWTDPGT